MTKPKPPAESAYELRQQVWEILAKLYVLPGDRVHRLASYFSTADLAEIRDELRKEL